MGPWDRHVAQEPSDRPRLPIATGTSMPVVVSGKPERLSASQTVAVRAVASSSPETPGRSRSESI